MTTKTRSDLATEIASSLADNTTGQITAEVMRGLVTDVVDSARLAEDLANVASSGVFSELIMKPTTISGYGITDAYTKSQVDTALDAKQPDIGSISFIEIGSSLTGDRASFIDFHADDTNTDYSARIIRNSGANGSAQFINNGAGGWNFDTRPTFGAYTPWDSGNFDPNAKVNKAGDTMTGNLAVAAGHLALYGWGDSNTGVIQFGTSGNAYAIGADGGGLSFYGFAALTLNGNTVYHAGNFDPASYLPLSGGTVSGGLSVGGTVTVQSKLVTAAAAQGDHVVGDATGGVAPIQVSSSSTGAAILGFNRTGAYAAYFGIDTDNKWKVGGWSMGANAYEVWHAGNFDPASKLNTTGNAIIKGGEFGIQNAAGQWGVALSYPATGIAQLSVFPDNDGSVGDTLQLNYGGNLLWQGHTVYHAGNFNPATKLDTAGGSITGSLSTSAAITLDAGTADTPEVRFVDSTTNTAAYIDMNLGTWRVYGYYHGGGTVVPLQVNMSDQSVTIGGQLQVSSGVHANGGSLNARDNCYVGNGASFLQTNGDVNGSAWGGYLSAWLTSNVAASPSAIGVGGVRTYAFCKNLSGTTIGPGGTVAGGSLRYSDGSDNAGVALGGSWMVLGNGGPNNSTLYYRYA